MVDDENTLNINTAKKTVESGKSITKRRNSVFCGSKLQKKTNLASKRHTLAGDFVQKVQIQAAPKDAAATKEQTQKPPTLLRSRFTDALAVYKKSHEKIEEHQQSASKSKTPPRPKSSEAIKDDPGAPNTHLSEEPMMKFNHNESMMSICNTMDKLRTSSRESLVKVPTLFAHLQ